MVKIFFSAVCILTLTLGIARFGFTIMFPIMQSEVGLGTAEGGWITSAHYVGYLIGVFIAFTLESSKKKELFLFWSLILSVLSTFLMAYTTSLVLWALIRLVAGFCGAAGVIIGAGLTMQWLRLNYSEPPQLGFYFAGIGFGILISSLASMFFTNLHFFWNQYWVGFGILSLLLFFPAWLLRPRVVADHEKKNIRPQATQRQEKMSLSLICLLAMYFFSGLSFVVSATFTLALAAERGFHQNGSLLAWMLVGLVSIPSLFFWDKVESFFSMFFALLMATLMQAVSLLLIIIFQGFEFFVISAVLFGMSNLGIVSLTMTLAGRINPNNSSKEMAKLTFSFALALIIGPFFTGNLAELTGSYDIPILVTGCLMLTGSILLILRKFFCNKKNE